jgi:WD40 repeat protein
MSEVYRTAFTSLSGDKEKLSIRAEELFISEDHFLTFNSSHITSYPETTHPFSFADKPYQWFADREAAHLLKEDEAITVSSVALPGYYVVGTSLGNVLVMMSEVDVDLLSYHAAPITCFHICHGKLVTCSQDGVLCLWPLSFDQTESVPLQRRQSVYAYREVSQPMKVIQASGGTVTQVLEVECLADTVETVSKQFWEHSWKNWEQTLLVQQDDGTLLLVSLITDEVVAHFFGLSGTVERASIHVMLEYLVVVCTDGAVFVFNMMSRTLERVLNASSASALLRQDLFPKRPSICFEELDVNLSPIHKLVHFNMKAMETSHCMNAISQSPYVLGSTRFSALSLDLTEEIACSELQINRLISMLNVTRHCEASMTDISEVLGGLVQLQSASLNANMGQFGVDGSVSFPLPSDKPIWSYSSSVSTKTALMLLSLLHMKTEPSLRGILPTVISRLVQSLTAPGFYPLDLVLLTCLALKQHRLASELLKAVLRSPSDLSPTCNFLMKLLREKYPIRSKRTSIPRPVGHHISALTVREQRVYVGEVEAFSAALLGYISVTRTELRQEHLIPMNLTLTSMLKADSVSFKQTSIYIIGRSLHVWRDLMTLEQQEDLLHCLIRIYMNDLESLQESALRALLTIGRADIAYSVRALSALMQRGETELQYFNALLSVTDQLVSNNALELPPYITEVVETVLLTLDPHKATLRKACLAPAAQIFHSLVSLLPMFTVCQEKQRLAIGTQSGLVVLYDLKTASRWKVLEAHSGAVVGVEFSSAGTMLATYSSEDQELKIWKLEAGFFGSLMGKSNLSQLHQFSLPSVTAAEDWTKVKVRWRQDNSLSLRREDSSCVDLSLN